MIFFYITIFFILFYSWLASWAFAFNFPSQQSFALFTLLFEPSIHLAFGFPEVEDGGVEPPGQDPLVCPHPLPTLSFCTFSGYPLHRTANSTVQAPMAGTPGRGGLLLAGIIPSEEEENHTQGALPRYSTLSLQGRDPFFIPIILSGNWGPGQDTQSAKNQGSPNSYLREMLLPSKSEKFHSWVKSWTTYIWSLDPCFPGRVGGRTKHQLRPI